MKKMFVAVLIGAAALSGSSATVVTAARHIGMVPDHAVEVISGTTGYAPAHNVHLTDNHGQFWR